MEDDLAYAFDINSFRDKHPELIERHHRFLEEKAYDVTDKLAQTILDCAKITLSRPTAEREQNFLEAFMLLASKVVSHAESARLLLNVGRYGGAAVIIRGLFSDVITIQYLSVFPEESPTWLELAKARGPTGTKDRAYRRLLDRFSEGHMRSKIEEFGQRPISSRASFGAYSEAVHAGAWGLQFYAFHELGPGGKFTIQFEPTYQPLVALREASLVGALMLQVTEDFLSWCEEQGVDWHRDVLEQWRPLQVVAIRILTSSMKAVRLGHAQFFQQEDRDIDL